MLIQKLKTIPRQFWILSAIIIFGLFLRTYNFHSWLDFGNDQVYDAQIIKKVVKGTNQWPLLGPAMSKSGNNSELTGGNKRDDRFHLGPAYYYFEIISAKIFGFKPEILAYPDLFFSVLSIWLFYLFLRRYFGSNLALVLAGLYAVSFYYLKFSHSAWNPNSIPFFVLLLLLSLHEFLVKKEKTRWFWAVFAGIALGIGIQLHAILLVLMPIFVFLIFIYLLKISRKTWRKWAIVFLIALILNAGQIVNEIKTNFGNSKIFISSLKDNGENNFIFLVNLSKSIDCHAQANVHIVSSLGNKNDCDFLLTGILTDDRDKKMEIFPLVAYLAGFLFFSLFGYVTLFIRWRREPNKEKKYFFGLIILYAAISFLVMFPVIETPLRYFIHTIFIPFIFLGFLMEIMAGVCSKKFIFFPAAIFLMLIAINYFSLKPVINELKSETRNSPDAVVLGETESMVNFIISQSAPQKEAYLLNSKKCANFLKPLNFLAEEKGFKLIIRKNEEEILPDKNVFYLSSKSKDGIMEKSGDEITAFENFGKVGIYRLNN